MSFLKHPYCLSLDGRWIIKDEEPGCGKAKDFFKSEYKPSGWVKADVPCTVQAALLKAKKIPDPYYARNNLQTLWIEDKEWWFKREFTVPREWKGKLIRLVFEGVDYKANFWLNDVHLGEHEGMFGGPIYDVSNIIKYGKKNILAVGIDPIPKNWRPTMKTSVFYGWHYGRNVPTGIWRPVGLVATGRCSLESTYVRTVRIAKEQADLHFEIDIQNEGERVKATTEGLVKGKNFESRTEFAENTVLEKGANKVSFEVKIANPRLWWPNDAGEQNLYTADLRLKMDDAEISDAMSFQFGVKTIEQLPTIGKKESDYNWVFCINGRKIYVKGANWGPIDSLLRFSSEKYRRFLTLAKEANINMLRAWGGGLMETEEFYDMCDELGIMVWQEFPLLPRGVPPKLVEEQVSMNIKRLRNRASLTLWTGGNEHSGKGEVIDLVESKCKELSPHIPFHRASPYGGDSHDWSVYHMFPADVPVGHRAYPVTHYVKNKAPFLSEFGLPAPPNLESIYKYMPAKERKIWPPKYGGSFIHHTPEYGSSPDMIKMLRYASQYGDVETMEDFVKYMQMSQAVAFRTGIEHVRAGMLMETGGTMFYKMNENYPACAWSVVDWYGVPKMAYYFVKQAYQPIHIFTRYDRMVWFEDEEFKAVIFVANDLLKELKGYQAEAVIFGSDFSTLHRTSESFDMGPNSVRKVLEVKWKVPEKTENAAPFFMRLTLKDDHGKTVSNTVYWYNFENSEAHQMSWRPHFDDFSSRMGCLTRLPRTALRLKVPEQTRLPKSEKATMTVKIVNDGKVPAFCTELKTPELGDRVRLSDNNFWLEADEEKMIEVTFNPREVRSIFLEAQAWNAPPTKRRFELTRPGE